MGSGQRPRRLRRQSGMRSDKGQPRRERAHREPRREPLPCLELLGGLTELGHERRAHQPEGLADFLRHDMEERSGRLLRLVRTPSDQQGSGDSTSSSPGRPRGSMGAGPNPSSISKSSWPKGRRNPDSGTAPGPRFVPGPEGGTGNFCKPRYCKHLQLAPSLP